VEGAGAGVVGAGVGGAVRAAVVVGISAAVGMLAGGGGAGDGAKDGGDGDGDGDCPRHPRWKCWQHQSFFMLDQPKAACASPASQSKCTADETPTEAAATESDGDGAPPAPPDGGKVRKTGRSQRLKEGSSVAHSAKIKLRSK